MWFSEKENIMEVIVGDSATLPTRQHNRDAGLDLYAAEDMFIPVNDTKKINTNIKISLPVNTVGMICDRSSMGSKGIKVMGGIVDSTYNGDIIVVLTNITCSVDRHAGLEKHGYWVKKGDKIAQLLVIPLLFPKCTEIQQFNAENTSRGIKGFGSSGR